MIFPKVPENINILYNSYLIVKFVLDCFGLFGLFPRNDAQPGVTARPIGESGFADSGEGLNINRTITHPSLPSYREGTRAVAQLAHSRRIVNFCNNFSKKPKVFAQFCRNT